MTRQDDTGGSVDRNTSVDADGTTDSDGTSGLTRRGALAGAVTTTLMGVAGCMAGDGNDTGADPNSSGGTSSYRSSIEEVESAVRSVENPPKAVYVPSHRNGMTMLPSVRVGDVAVALMATYPHRFWTVTGTGREAVPVDRDHDIHLMATVWDPQTGTVLPTDEGLRFEIRTNGTLVDSRTPWSMLSQNMGFHFGDNVILDGDGTYDITIQVPPLGVRKTGNLAGRFEAGGSATVQFAFDQQFRDAVFEKTKWVEKGKIGVKGAIDPGRGGGGTSGTSGMSDGGPGMAPYSTAPAPAALPGRPLGESKSGDADLVATLLDPGSRFADEQYLLVSARTPYNKIPLPALGLSTILRRNGSQIETATLSQVVDHEVGLHYGTALPAAQSGDEIEMQIDSPPQAARHQGYETAFLDMPAVTVSVPEVS
jgi:hypothetical protein